MANKRPALGSVVVALLLGVAGYFMLSNPAAPPGTSSLSEVDLISEEQAASEPVSSVQSAPPLVAAAHVATQHFSEAVVAEPNIDEDAIQLGTLSEADVEEEGLLERLVVDGSIRLSEMTPLMVFDKQVYLLRALRGETLTPEQSMRSYRYRQFVSQQPEFFNGQLTLNRMECGTSLCVLSVAINDVQGWDSLQVSLRASEETPVSVLLAFGSDEMQPPQHWLMFPIDPGIQSIAVHGELHPIRPLPVPE